MSIQYDGYVGWSNAYKVPGTVTAQQYMQLINETNFNTYGTATNWASIVPQSILDKVNSGWTGTDWFKEYENKNAIQTSHAVTLTGGSERSKFSFSMYSYMGHKSLANYWLNGDNSGSMFTNTCNTYKKEYWTPENPTNKYGRLNAVGPSGVTGISKLYNRNFVRVDNITLGYTLPKELTQKVGLERVHFSAAIHNAFTIDSWEYGDPETGGFSNRQFIFGVNVTM